MKYVKDIFLFATNVANEYGCSPQFEDIDNWSVLQSSSLVKMSKFYIWGHLESVCFNTIVWIEIRKIVNFAQNIPIVKY
jgi:hypothetical protein